MTTIRGEAAFVHLDMGDDELKAVELEGVIYSEKKLKNKAGQRVGRKHFYQAWVVLSCHIRSDLFDIWEE
jgi:hypothetical protein